MKTKFLILSILLFCFLNEGKSQERDVAPFIRAGEYCEFLNAVAASDPHHLYDEKMGEDLVNTYIRRIGVLGTYNYKVLVGKEDLPIKGINFSSAMRYCNWKGNTFSTSSDWLNPFNAEAVTETGTYELNGDQLVSVNEQGPYRIETNLGELSKIDIELKSNQLTFCLVSASIYQAGGPDLVASGTALDDILIDIAALLLVGEGGRTAAEPSHMEQAADAAHERSLHAEGNESKENQGSETDGAGELNDFHRALPALSREKEKAIEALQKMVERNETKWEHYYDTTDKHWNAFRKAWSEDWSLAQIAAANTQESVSEKVRNREIEEKKFAEKDPEQTWLATGRDVTNQGAQAAVFVPEPHFQTIVVPVLSLISIGADTANKIFYSLAGRKVKKTQQAEQKAIDEATKAQEAFHYIQSKTLQLREKAQSEEARLRNEEREKSLFLAKKVFDEVHNNLDPKISFEESKGIWLHRIGISERLLGEVKEKEEPIITILQQQWKKAGEEAAVPRAAIERDEKTIEELSQKLSETQQAWHEANNKLNELQGRAHAKEEYDSALKTATDLESELKFLNSELEGAQERIRGNKLVLDQLEKSALEATKSYLDGEDKASRRIARAQARFNADMEALTVYWPEIAGILEQADHSNEGKLKKLAQFFKPSNDTHPTLFTSSSPNGEKPAWSDVPPSSYDKAITEAEEKEHIARKAVAAAMSKKQNDVAEKAFGKAVKATEEAKKEKESAIEKIAKVKKNVALGIFNTAQGIKSYLNEDDQIAQKKGTNRDARIGNALKECDQKLETKREWINKDFCLNRKLEDALIKRTVLGAKTLANQAKKIAEDAIKRATTAPLADQASNWDEAITKVKEAIVAYNETIKTFVIREQFPERYRPSWIENHHEAEAEKDVLKAQLSFCEANKAASLAHAVHEQAMNCDDLEEKSSLQKEAINKAGKTISAWNRAMIAFESGQKESPKQFQYTWDNLLQHATYNKTYWNSTLLLWKAEKQAYHAEALMDHAETYMSTSTKYDEAFTLNLVSSLTLLSSFSEAIKQGHKTVSAFTKAVESYQKTLGMIPEKWDTEKSSWSNILNDIKYQQSSWSANLLEWKAKKSFVSYDKALFKARNAYYIEVPSAWKEVTKRISKMIAHYKVAEANYDNSDLLNSISEPLKTRWRTDFIFIRAMREMWEQLEAELTAFEKKIIITFEVGKEVAREAAADVMAHLSSSKVGMTLVRKMVENMDKKAKTGREVAQDITKFNMSPWAEAVSKFDKALEEAEKEREKSVQGSNEYTVWNCIIEARQNMVNLSTKTIKCENTTAQKWRDVATIYQQSIDLYIKAANAYTDKNTEEGNFCKNAGDAFYQQAVSSDNAINAEIAKDTTRADQWREVIILCQKAIDPFTKAANAYTAGKTDEGNSLKGMGLNFYQQAVFSGKAIDAEIANNTTRADQWKEVIILCQKAIDPFTKAANAYAAGKTSEGNYLNRTGWSFYQQAVSSGKAIDAEIANNTTRAEQRREVVLLCQRSITFYAKAANVHGAKKTAEGTCWQNIGNGFRNQANFLGRAIDAETANDTARAEQWRKIVHLCQQSINFFTKAAFAHAIKSTGEGTSWNKAGLGFYYEVVSLEKAIDAEITKETKRAEQWRKVASLYQQSIDPFTKAAEAYASGNTTEGARLNAIGLEFYNKAKQQSERL